MLEAPTVAANLHHSRPSDTEEATQHPVRAATEETGKSDDFACPQLHGIHAIGACRQQHLAARNRGGRNLLRQASGHGTDEIAHGESAAPAHCGDAAITQHRATVGDCDDFIELMRNVDDGGALRLHAGKHGEQSLDLALFQCRSRLVQDEDAALPA